MFRSGKLSRRIAFLNGCSGQADRIIITGQFFEVPVTEGQMEEAWEPFLNLPLSSLRTIRPVTDIRISRLKGFSLCIVITKGLDSEPQSALFKSEPIKTDENGVFRIAPGHTLPPGELIVRVFEIHDFGSGDLTETGCVGAGKIRVLPNDYDGVIVISDIDRTFLNTNIASTRGMIETLFETPDRKSPLIGMPEVYRLLNQISIPLFFLSASPHFYRRTLLSVFHLHGIDPTGLHLKSLIDSLDGIINKILFSVTNFEKFIGEGIRQAFSRSMKFLGSSYQSFFDQVAYKLTALLEHRLMQPTGAREILIGDNSESDFFIFSVYQILLMGDLKPEETERYLYDLRFHGRDAFTSDSAKRIAALASENLLLHGPVNAVEAVWINLAEAEPDEYLMLKQIHESLPESVPTRIERLVEPRACCGSIDFALLAYDSGVFKREHLVQFRNSLFDREDRGEVELLHKKAEMLIDTLKFQDKTGEEVLEIFQ